jgi:NADH-quinone oxidoreductase subunit L
VVLALLMLYAVAFPLYRNRYGATEQLKQGAWRPLYLWSYNKWYIDEFYNSLLVIPGVWLSHVFWRIVDLKIVDGIVNGVAWVLGALGQLFRPLQTGFIRNYALYLLIGAVLFLLYNLVAAVKTSMW